MVVTPYAFWRVGTEDRPDWALGCAEDGEVWVNAREHGIVIIRTFLWSD